MKKYFLAATLATTMWVPSVALAQQSCQREHGDRVVGTVAGAGIGAVLGSVIAGHGDRTAGAVIGGVGGAIAGNQIAKSSADCAHAYGYYDQSSRWHASAVSRSDARGYYDREGKWVDGAPNGFYDDNGRWNGASTDPSAAGYYDSRGYWVPASANGYYDNDDQWVGGTASGYYDDRGRWNAGPTTGRYDANGRWSAGAANGHRDSNGSWVAEAQPGYYDSNARWHVGPASGYYDGQGRWISTGRVERDRSADSDHPRDVRSRTAWLEQRIRSEARNGDLSRSDANGALRELNAIRRQDFRARSYGRRPSPRDVAAIQERLDRLGDTLRLARN